MGFFINRHLTMLTDSELTGYNIQYLRRLLRSDSLRGIKIDQIWLIEMESLKTYLQHVENTSDRP